MHIIHAKVCVFVHCICMYDRYILYNMWAGHVCIIYKFTLEMDRKGCTSLNCRVLICAGLVEIRVFFWLSWVDLHGVYSTLMFFSTFWGLYELTLFPRWKTDCKVWHASYFSLLSDFPCKPTCPNVKSYKLITWERKERSIKSVLKVT